MFDDKTFKLLTEAMSKLNALRMHMKDNTHDTVLWVFIAGHINAAMRIMDIVYDLVVTRKLEDAKLKNDKKKGGK